MTVLLEYVTALLEYHGFSLQGMHRPKSGWVISTAFTEYIYHQFNYLGFKCLYCTAKLTPCQHGLLILKWSMHTQIDFDCCGKMTTHDRLSQKDLCPPNVRSRTMQ